MSYTIEPAVPASHAIIWMHGLGASYHDMVGLVQQMAIETLSIKHIFLQAPTRKVTINQFVEMPAWYDIKMTSLLDREDEAGLNESKQIVLQTITELNNTGFSSKQIFLAGFSQGGAMALYTGLGLTDYLAGVISLSAYLPMSNHVQKYHKQRKTVPIFMAYGNADPVVLPAWTVHSANILKELGYKRISLKSYPMMHQVCPDELTELREWLAQRVS